MNICVFQGGNPTAAAPSHQRSASSREQKAGLDPDISRKTLSQLTGCCFSLWIDSSSVSPLSFLWEHRPQGSPGHRLEPAPTSSEFPPARSGKCCAGEGGTSGLSGRTGGGSVPWSSDPAQLTRSWPVLSNRWAPLGTSKRIWNIPAHQQKSSSSQMPCKYRCGTLNWILVINSVKVEQYN